VQFENTAGQLSRPADSILIYNKYMLNAFFTLDYLAINPYQRLFAWLFVDGASFNKHDQSMINLSEE
jgi:hypothetical protein